jgi:hypothetical protein
MMATSLWGTRRAESARRVPDAAVAVMAGETR